MREKLRILDKAVDRLGYWIGGWSIVSGAFTGLWTQVSFLHNLGWAEYILLGIASGSLLVLILSACLASWRFFRPSPFTAAPSGGFGERRGNDQERMDYISARIDDLNKSLTDLSERVDVACQTFQSNKHYIEGTRDGLQDIFRDLRASFKDLEASNEQFKSRVVRLLLAKQHMERAVKLAADIQATGKSLGETRDIPPEDQDEESWRARFERWKSSIRDYESLARDVDPSLPPASKTNAEDYRDDRWPEFKSRFASSLLLHDYKEYRLILLQFEALHELVLSKLWIDSSI